MNGAGRTHTRREWVLEHTQEIIAARADYPGKTDAWIAAELYAEATAVTNSGRVQTVTAWVESLYGGPGWHVVGGCANCHAPLEDGDLAIVVEVNQDFTGAACLNCVAGWDLPAPARGSS